MSNITKLFVILVAILAVVVSSMTIVQVSNRENYRDQVTSLRQRLDAAEANARSRGQELANLEGAQSLAIANLKNQISQLQTQINVLQGQKATAEEAAAKAQGDMAKQQADQGRLAATLELALNEMKLKDAELKDLRDAKIMLDKQLKETTARNIELDAQNQQQARLIRKQQEDMTDLRGGGGGAPGTAAAGSGAAATPITRPPVPEHVIFGKITRIENVGDRKLAQVNVGAADGVVQGMQFVISRGKSQFVANLTVTAVDERTSAGVLELVQGAGPQVGDDVFAGH